MVGEFVRDLKRYGIAKVTGDRYAGEWPREQFRKLGVEYEISELDRSALYLETLPAINSGAVELLDNNRLTNQLAGLERRVGRSGKDAVDHPRRVQRQETQLLDLDPRLGDLVAHHAHVR